MMTRGVYQFILWMHPPAFRRRFCDEMLSIFDEGGTRHSGLALLLDGLISVARQWLLRTGFWKFPIAMGGAFIQVFGFAYPIKSHQSWTKNHQALTPYMQEIMVITLALLGSLLVMIMWLALRTVRSQRRRSQGRRLHLAGIATARHLARLHPLK